MTSPNFKHMESIKRLRYRLFSNMITTGIDAGVKEWVTREMQAHNPLIERVTGEKVYQDYILTYVTRERTKYQHAADSPKNPYGESRDTPLCIHDFRCDCPIQQGEEPLEFQEYDDIDRAIRQFKKRHPGDPVVLDEARREFAEDRGRVKKLLRELTIAISSNEIPDFRDMDDAELREMLSPDDGHDDDYDDGDDGDNGKRDSATSDNGGIDGGVADPEEIHERVSS